MPTMSLIHSAVSMQYWPVTDRWTEGHS